MPIFDAHAHLPAGPEAESRFLGLMDRCEIARAVVIPGGTVSRDVLARNIAFGGGANVTPDNARVREACARSAGRLVPFYFANPYADADDYASVGAAYRGLKLGPAVHGIPFDDVRIRRLVEVAARLGHPVYLHCLARDGFRVSDVVTLAAVFPEVPIIVGHAAGGHCEFHAIGALVEAKNTFLEMSGGFTSFVVAAVKQLGAERVLFGSEYPLQDPRAELAKMRCIDSTPQELALMLGGNIERLLAPRAS